MMTTSRTLALGLVATLTWATTMVPTVAAVDARHTTLRGGRSLPEKAEKGKKMKMKMTPKEATPSPTTSTGGDTTPTATPTTKKPKPVIFDTDYGPFIDDVFALGLLVNSGDLLDLKYVLTTSENPELSAKCVAKHLDLAQRSDIPVGVGAPFPPYEERGGICAIPGLVGFALQSVCENVTLPYSDTGLEDVADLILNSGRDDWWYIVVGGQTSARKMVEEYPGVAARIEQVIIMGGNWCADFFPYPDVLAPTDETNIACDPSAANFILDGKYSPFKNVQYVPVEMADVIGGTDYIRFVEAAQSGDVPSATATLDFYKFWSEAGRADPDLLIHAEALTYDPELESTPQFDPCAIMVALELLNDECEDRMTMYDFSQGVSFLEAGQGEAFPASPRSGFSLLPVGTNFTTLPAQCPSLTPFTFDPSNTSSFEIPVSIALGYKSPGDKKSFFADMASRMAGELPLGCTTASPTMSPAPSAMATTAAPTNSSAA